MLRRERKTEVGLAEGSIRSTACQSSIQVITAAALMAMLTGLAARATVSLDAPLVELMQQHRINGVAVTIATCLAAVVAIVPASTLKRPERATL